MKVLEVPGKGFLFVLRAPLGESLDSDVVVLPQSQIEEHFDPGKTPEIELVTGELALGLRRHLLKEQIAFYEDRVNLEQKIRRSREFPEESHLM